MTISPLAGNPAPKSILVDVAQLDREYYQRKPDLADPTQLVSFGTSGHRGSSLRGTFNEAHILAITQAICDYRKGQNINGPLYMGKDTHALSGPAQRSALEVLAANNIESVIQPDDGVTPVPVISHAIIVYNRGRKQSLADGIAVTPSHNPPEDGGFKYNSTNGGPADVEVTAWVQKRANELLRGKNVDVKKTVFTSALKAATTHQRDFVLPYVNELRNVVDMEAIRSAGLKLGVDPLGGSSLPYWEPINSIYKLNVTVVNTTLDPQFAFMTVDHDGKIRMDCSSPYAMARLVGLKDKFRVAFANDPDADRHGIVTPGAGLMNPNHYLAVAIGYLLTHRPHWLANVMVGKTIVSIAIMHPDDQPRVRAAVAAATRPDDPAPYDIEYRIVHPDGSIRWVLAKGRANFTDPGPGQSERKLVSFDGTAADITERRRTEEALEVSEVRYRRLFEAAHDGILILDPTNRQITDVNPFLLELLNYPREYFIGKELWEIGVFNDKAESQAAMNKVRENGSIRFENKPLQDRNGRRHAVEIVANAYQEDHHPVIQCNIRDIGERARFDLERAALLANEQASRMEAEAANRAKDMFLATLSHELRTPLTAILGWAVILRSAAADEKVVKEAALTIERNARMQSQLIGDVLDVSRIVSGKLRLDLRPCELSKIIEDAVASVQPAADAKEIQIRVKVISGASPAFCDAARIQQVIWNLLTNAIKFSPKLGKIDVLVKRVNSMVCITITDSGEGISPEFLPHVFERFRQSDGTSTRKHGGLGLGLSIVWHLIELHGGTVEAKSEGLGRGATFIINLPIRAVIDVPVGGDESAGPDGLATSGVEGGRALVRLDGLRVLVVDDELDARNVIKAALVQAGATVAAADSGNEALKLLEAMHPHVIVSDISMPGQDGYELMKQIRSMGAGFSGRDLPAIALTAYARTEDRRRALLAGFQMHVAKPVDPHELAEVVASLAGRTGLS